MLEVRHISKTFRAFSLADISFRVEPGEYFMLLGVSGAGKSMLLEIIAGLEHADTGQVFLEGMDITRRSIQHRGTGLVFQDLAVFPHMTVAENIAYSLHGTHLTHTQKHQQVMGVAAKMNIDGLLHRKPGTLSGGELQRVALARTLIQDPKVLLLDEPLSSLDSQLRSGIRSLLRRLNREGQTIIHVTHDYEEAISLADRVAVMHQGKIVQSGQPEAVFQNPESEFVAHFTGAKNFFRARTLLEDGKCYADMGYGTRVRLGSETGPGVDGFLLIRGEDLILSGRPFDSSVTNSLKGTIREIVPSRNGMEVIVEAGHLFHALVTQDSVVHLALREGSEVWVSFKAMAVKFIAT